MRKLISLLPWMVLAGAAYGQVRSADVLYTHFDSSPVRGYRIGDEVFVALDDVSKWDWSVSTKADLAFVKAEGVQFMVPTRNIGGRLVLPMIQAVKQAGGLATWDDRAEVLHVNSEISAVTIHDGSVKVYSNFATVPKVAVLDGPSRVQIDFPGCIIGSKTQESLDSGATISQINANDVRLVIPTDQTADLGFYRPVATRNFGIEIPHRIAAPKVDDGGKPNPKNTVSPPIPDPNPPTTTPPTTQPDESTTPPSETIVPMLDLQLLSEDDKGLEIQVNLPTAIAAPAQARRPQPEILEVTLPGVAMMLPDNSQLNSPSIKSVTRIYNGKGTVVRFEFTRPMAAELVTDGKLVHIQVIKPSISGSLAGKVIVVDPGHGGHDSGALGNGLREKDLNLVDGIALADALTAEGATVILTRKTDVFIPLHTRGMMANDSNADLFISCHVNSVDSGNSSGAITFHHMGREISKLLAECINREISKVSQLPSMGVWSDGKVYTSGFSVLRETNMPGVLLELGFITSATDCKRVSSPTFAKDVASAIVRGIKVYLGNGQ